MDLSIIIVSYNTKDILNNCLRSIYDTIAELEFEIHVIDNHSSDGTPAMVLSKYPEVRLIVNEKNIGFSKANNQGIKRARGDFILLLNSDTILLDNCLKKLVSFGRMNSRVGLFACQVLNEDKSLQYSCARFPSFLSEIFFFSKVIILDIWDPFSTYKFMEEWDHSDTREVDCLFACFLMIKREVFDQVGYLDENFFMYYEDVEFCRRVQKETEFKILYVPDHQIIHLGMASANPKSHTMIKNCFQSILYYFEKWHGKAYAFLFKYTCKFIWLLEMILFFLLQIIPKCRKKYEMLKSLFTL